MVKDFRELRIWQNGMEIVKGIYFASKKNPREEVFGITSQIRRAAVSIPSNIAEGFARNHTKEYKQFLYVALSSCAELETQLEIIKFLKYGDEKETISLELLIKQEIRMLVKMLNSF